MRAALAALPFLLAAAAAPEGEALRLSGPAVQGALLHGTAPPGTVWLTLDGAPVPLASDGRFVIGLDRDRTSPARLEARTDGGGTVVRELAVLPRRWKVQHVAIARRPSGATPEYLRLRERELERISAARSAGSPSEGWRQPFQWPARGRISGVFGSQRIYRGEPGSFHTGVDVAAGAGAPVSAPADGVVVLAPPPAFSLEGNLVILDHGMGLSSAFLHLSSVAVREGQRVRRGEPIGRVGATGRATGPHLHWSLVLRGARVDPAPVAGPMPR